MSKTVSGDVGRGPGGEYLDDALTQLGFTGNAELSRLTDVSESLLWKYRKGRSRPNNENLGKIVSVIVPLAKRHGIALDPVEFYVRFGLITRDELEQESIDPLYVALVQLDRDAGAVDAAEQQRLRDHVELIIEGTRRRLEAKRDDRRGKGRQAG